MATEPLYLAVDGGGSTTRLALHDGSGRRLGLTQTGPTSLTIRGAAAWQTILQSLQALCDAAGADPSTVLARIHIGLGIAGANSETLRRAFLAAAPAAAGIRLGTDSYIAALGAHGGAPGAIIISGTGSAGYRLMADGSSRLVGAWGFPVDDAGSGAWLGHRAIGEALHLLDGRWSGQPGGTAVYQAVLDHCGRGRAALLDWLHQAPSTRYAELAPIVLRFAAAGDPSAQRLARDTGKGIEKIARALDPTGAVPLALVGGLAAPLGPYLPPRLAAWARPPRDEPIAGALMLATGRARDEVIIDE